MKSFRIVHALALLAFILTGCSQMESMLHKERKLTAQEAEALQQRIRQNAGAELDAMEEEMQTELHRLESQGQSNVTTNGVEMPALQFLRRHYAPRVGELRDAAQITAQQLRENVRIPELDPTATSAVKNTGSAVAGPFGWIVGLGVPFIASLYNGWRKSKALKAVIKANGRVIADHGGKQSAEPIIQELRRRQKEVQGDLEVEDIIKKIIGKTNANIPIN